MTGQTGHIDTIKILKLLLMVNPFIKASVENTNYPGNEVSIIQAMKYRLSG
jgi:hypothetical protein